MTTSTSEHRTEDRTAIAELMTAWVTHRDAGHWSGLARTFAPDASIEVTWATTTATEFVEAAARDRGGPLRSTHLLTPAHVGLRGARAIAETSAVLLTDHDGLDLGAVTYARFLDRLVRDGVGWRIQHRVSVYDAGSFTFPFGPAVVDDSIVRRFPREYAPLAYLLTHAGHEPSSDSPTTNSVREAAIRRAQEAWLHGSDH